MAPSLPSCISSTFCAHKQASWFLLATLAPFFLPFLILCVPFLLLFLAPVSCCLFFLLLLYKVQASMRPKLKCFQRRADKGVLNEGYQPTEQIAAAGRLDIPPVEKDREFKGLEGSNVHIVESHKHLKEGNTAGLHILPSRLFEFEEEEPRHIEEDCAALDGITEGKTEEKQEGQEIPSVEKGREETYEGPDVSHIEEDRAALDGITEGETGEKQEEQEIPSVEEGREETYEGLEVSNVQNVELPASGVEEGLQSPKRESNFREETQEGMGKGNDMMEDNKQEEVEMTEELIDFKDEQTHSPVYVDATSSHTSEENRTSLPLTRAHEGLDIPYSYSSVPLERQGPESLDDRNERLGSSHMHPLEEAWSKLPAIHITEPDFEAKMADHSLEKPWEDEPHEQFDVDTPFTEIVTPEHVREEPELSSKKDSNLQILGYKGRSDKKEDVVFPAEPFERKIEEGEPSYDSPRGHGQWRTEAFTKETRDDVHPQKGGRPNSLAVSFEAESSAEREEGYPHEATCSTVALSHVSHGGIEFQDRIQEEQKVIADINAIKKIVGYQGEPHASIMEQISGLYMFLGLEPYNWATEVDNLVRAQSEIELLKVVVGVK